MMDEQHIMQHENSPTWCIHCGTFDRFATGFCSAEPTGMFDSDANFVRMFEEMFALQRYD